MDIREWLQNTTDREPPDERVEAGFPAFLQPQPDAAQPIRRSRQKRKRASSDPLVPAQRRSRERRPTLQPSSSSEQARPTGGGAAATSSRSSSSSRSQSWDSAVSKRHGAPIKAFQKRARYKTKPDRYESKPKRKKKEHKTTREKKPSKRRKSNRSGDGARTTGLVQSFQLKNGPKNQRLTLKPDASAGIFKNGRASGPVATSGPGLPDLVFNEMRFLRRPKEHQDELPIEDSTKQSKKTRKQIHEEEISAYFSKNLQPDKQVSVPKPDAARSQAIKKTAPQRPPELDLGPPKHPVELPEKAFLGFGSRGPPQEGVESQPPSNSYYTWSESVPAKRSPAPARPAVPAFASTNERSERRERQPSQVSNTSLPRRQASLPRPRSDRSEAESGRWLQSRRAKGPAVVEVYQPRTHAHRRRAPALNDSSEPLPRAVPISRNAQREEMNSRWEVGSYHTSDILKIRDTIREAGHSSSLPGRGHVSKAVANKENEHPATSTPTSERLRHAFGAVTKPQEIAVPKTQARPLRQSREERAGPEFEPPIVPHTLFHGPPELEPSSPRWEMPQRGFSRTSDAIRSQQRPSTRLGTARPMTAQVWPTQSIRLSRATDRFDEVQEEEMLDVLPNAPLIRPPRDCMQTNTREAEALLRRLESDRENRVVPQAEFNSAGPSFGHYEYSNQEQQMEREQSFEPTSFAPDFFSFQSQPLNEQLSGEQFQSEHYTADCFQGEGEVDSGHREAANAELAGFWRPNILY